MEQGPPELEICAGGRAGANDLTEHGDRFLDPALAEQKSAEVNSRVSVRAAVAAVPSQGFLEVPFSLFCAAQGLEGEGNAVVHAPRTPVQWQRAPECLEGGLKLV